MSIVRISLAALLLAAPLPLSASPADYAPAVSDRGRSEAHRNLDASRMPAEILDFAQVRPGQTVVDYFAGDGYYSELFARAVGPRGTVYALNPVSFHDPKDWPPLQARHRNLRTLVAPVTGLQMAPASVDMLFTHLNYHDLYWESERYNFVRVDVPQVLAAWFRAVRPGGSVVIVDHVGPAGDPREVANRLHRIDPERVKADMAAAGFVFEAESAVLRRSTDDHTKGVFDAAVRGNTDRFSFRFRRP